ncbi:hypothetical protein GQR58_002553 [Nymphon striatum]|nr:hypothetical protein GQR58_002553 [Nymphon striatum]
MERKCIIHYKGFTEYKNLKELSERNKGRILEAKKEREKLGGEHHHKDQCDGIPEKFGAKDCIHLEPCYKKFTLILAGQSTRQSNDRRSSSRKSIGEISAWTYSELAEELGDNVNDEIDDRKSKKDFNAVKLYIESTIIRENKVVSMKILQTVYGDNSDDKRYRHKLKQRIVNEFPDLLQFVQPSSTSPELVFSTNIDRKLPRLEPQSNVVSVAKQLRQDIISYCGSVAEHKWPPTFESVTAEYGNPPESIKLFLKHLLTTEKSRANREKACRLVDSVTSDFVHNISRGKVITPKHYLFALGLHNLTGQKQAVVLANKFGHCMAYDLCCEIETSLSEASVAKSKETSLLPIVPEGSQTVLTVFWVDNFDVIVEKNLGGGAVNTTHLMAFQEQAHHAKQDIYIPVQRSKKRKLNALEDDEHVAFTIDTATEPPRQASSQDFSYDNTPFQQLQFIWLYLRKCNHYDQAVPNFTGWRQFGRKFVEQEGIKKTVETYLPPISSKVTEFSTIAKYMTYLQSLAASSNMSYVNITLDVGAAMNSYKFLWSNQHLFGNVVIHLGDFHFMKENFQVIGMLVDSSGFEDVVFQSGICSSGSLNGVINGRQYNRAWFVHSIFSEALERLLLRRFLAETRPKIPKDLEDMVVDPETFDGRVSEDTVKLFQKYERYRQDVREGAIGKTAQFWLLYLDLMRIQHQIHTSVQTNDFDMRLDSWERMLPMYFAFNKTNYARYGTWYVQTLKEIDDRYPGLKPLLQSNGLSVQAQTACSIRTSIDQRGEQSINRDAKTPGGIRFFASNKEAILKWCLNRADVAKSTGELKKMAGVSKQFNMYKPMRPSQILLSEKKVAEIVRILEEEFINPFGVGYNNLCNLSSGVQVADDLASAILDVRQNGIKMKEEFVSSRITSQTAKFHDKLTRCSVKTFKSLNKCIVKLKHVQATVEVNRNILGSLLAFSISNERVIDLPAALTYPLSPIPLSLATADGHRRKTSKSKLTSLLIDGVTLKDPKADNSIRDIRKNTTFVLDLIAAIRTMTNLPNTYEEFVWNFVSTLPKGCKRLDIVADTYRKNSIKGGERNARGSSQKVIIASSKSRLPRDFSAFMRNGENKTRLIEIISEVLRNNFKKVLAMLRCPTICISQEDVTYCVTESGVTVKEELSSNHEEADTKVILHSYKSMQEDPSSKVVLRSPSGDTDILVLAVALLDSNRVYLDYGKGKLRRGFWLNSISMDDQLKRALIGFHAFTGNDYVSSFFKKGKQMCWKVMKKNQNFVEAFCLLGVNWSVDVNDGIFQVLERYVCTIYGYPRETMVNVVRSKLFDKKFTKGGKVIDMALLPPCSSSLVLHIKRANYVAKIWRSSLTSWLDAEEITESGWLADGETYWVDDIFPLEIEEILCDQAYNADDDFDEEDEQSSSDDDN